MFHLKPLFKLFSEVPEDKKGSVDGAVFSPLLKQNTALRSAFKAVCLEANSLSVFYTAPARFGSTAAEFAAGKVLR